MRNPFKFSWREERAFKRANGLKRLARESRILADYLLIYCFLTILHLMPQYFPKIGLKDYAIKRIYIVRG